MVKIFLYSLIGPVFLLAGWVQAFEISGQFEQGGLLFGQAGQGEAVILDGEQLQQDGNGRFIIGLDRDEPATLVLLVQTSEGAVEHVFEISPRNYRIQRIEGVEQKYVAPDPEQVERSRKEAALVWEARQQRSEQNAFMQGFIWPAIGPITGVFGSQRVYNGEPRRPHYGVDVAAPVGTVVVAPAGGTVTLAENDLFFSGGTIIIDHGHGLSSSFLHLSRVDVEAGKAIRQGEAIGEIGATGRVTGAHLDWRMNWTGAGRNARIDPQLLVEDMATLLEANQ